MANITLKVTTTRDYSCTLDRTELLRILNGGSSKFPLAHRLPDDTQMVIAVPSGGDYSGCILDITEAGGLRLSWRITEEK